MRPLLRLLLTFLLLLSPITIMPAGAEDAAAAPASQVLSYEGDAQLAELAAKGTTVVFFYAAWCPNCRATVTELNARWDEVNPGLTLVIADYDKERHLPGYVRAARQRRQGRGAVEQRRGQRPQRPYQRPLTADAGNHRARLRRGRHHHPFALRAAAVADDPRDSDAGGQGAADRSDRRFRAGVHRGNAGIERAGAAHRRAARYQPDTERGRPRPARPGADRSGAAIAVRTAGGRTGRARSDQPEQRLRRRRGGRPRARPRLEPLCRPDHGVGDHAGAQPVGGLRRRCRNPCLLARRCRWRQCCWAAGNWCAG